MSPTRSARLVGVGLSVGLSVLLACDAAKPAVEPDAGAGEVGGDPDADSAGPDDDDDGDDDGGDGDVADDSSAGSNLDACQPGLPCSTYGESCVVGRRHCTCASPCSGPELPPEENYPRWACREVDPSCPEAIPEHGARCRPNDLRCGWGFCGGTSAVCEQGEWSVQSYGPPA